MFLLRGLCLGSHVPSRASLFKGVSVQGSLCPGGVSPGLSPSGDLCPGVVLCPEEGLCPRGSLLCYFQGVSVQQGLCSGGSLSRGSMSRGGLCPRESLSVGSLSAERDPRTGKNRVVRILPVRILVFFFVTSTPPLFVTNISTSVYFQSWHFILVQNDP